MEFLSHLERVGLTHLPTDYEEESINPPRVVSFIKQVSENYILLRQGVSLGSSMISISFLLQVLL